MDNAGRMNHVTSQDDRCRVKDGEPEENYINASWVQDFTGRFSYIASQGPVDNTLVDFWKMVWQEKVDVIVMVTDLYELGRKKCTRYWPAEVGGQVLHGDITVTSQSDHVVPEAGNVRKRILIVDKNNERRSVIQFQYMGWPDHGTPALCSSLLNLRKVVRQVKRAEKRMTTNPILVHCSAGVGRTGTYMLIDDVLNQYEASGKFSVEETAHRFRHYRGRMIQADIQYVYANHVILEALKVGDTGVPRSAFVQRYQRSGASLTQFQVLDLIRQLNMEERCKGKLPENADKNRVANIIPIDYDRPPLMSGADGENKYINACLMMNLSNSPRMIATQLPLEHTKVDFWRLIYELQVKIIIRMDGDKVEKESECYWPVKGCTHFGPFYVELKHRADINSMISVETIELQNTEQIESPPTEVCMIVYHMWPEAEMLPHASAMLDLYQTVRHLQSDNQQSVLVQCWDGATKSGLFCAAYCLLEYIRLTNIVDVYQSTRLTQSTRAQCIPDMAQFNLLHEIAVNHLCQFPLCDAER